VIEPLDQQNLANPQKAVKDILRFSPAKFDPGTEGKKGGAGKVVIYWVGDRTTR
jgi:hypothetical protein